MARILVNMPSQYGGKPSGVARVLFSLLNELIHLGGHEYILRSAWSVNDLPKALQGTVEVETIRRPRVMIADVLRQAVIMPFVCRRTRADVVWNVDTFGTARGGRARVTTVHDLYYRNVSALSSRSRLTMKLCYQFVVHGSTQVVSISQATANELVEAFPQVADRLLVITNDATIPQLVVDAEEREIDGHYVLIVGNVTPNKNYGVVVDALRLLTQRGDKAPTLAHVGFDDDEMIVGSLKNAIPDLEFRSFSNIDDSMLASLYKNADCLIVPSISEGFCLPIIEAQALGCPVLASNRSVMPEVAGDGALYFEPTNPIELAILIEKLTTDTQARAMLIERGHLNRSRFSWRASARAYHNVFTELAK